MRISRKCTHTFQAETDISSYHRIIQVERRTREIPPAGRFGGTSYTMGLAWNVKSSEGEGLYRCYSEEPTEYPFTLGAELVFETDRKFFQLNRTRCLLLVRFRRLDNDDDDNDDYVDNDDEDDERI